MYELAEDKVEESLFGGAIVTFFVVFAVSLIAPAGHFKIVFGDFGPEISKNL